MEKKSYWQREEKDFHFGKEDQNNTDVLIIGAGMCGVVLAYELSKQKKLKITLVDQQNVIRDTSAKTSAKITPMHHLLYQDIRRIHGLQKAKQYYQSQVEAMNYLKEIVETEKIDCDFKHEKNYMYATTKKGCQKLEREIQVLQEMNVPFEQLTEIPLEIPIKNAFVYEENYVFHPIKYLNHILGILHKKNNVTILENWKAIGYEKKENLYCISFENKKVIQAKDVVVSTHYPIFNFAGLYFTKLYQEKSYLVSFLSKKPIDGIYLNCENPVCSLRRQHNMILLVGNSHISGKKIDESEKMKQLLRQMKKIDLTAQVSDTWTNQDVMSIDFLPLIGTYSRFLSHMWVATAYQTWGMTNSHASALLLAREIMHTSSPYHDLYSPLRFSHIKSWKESLKMIGRSTNGLVLSRILEKTILLDDLKDDEGAIVQYENNRYAAYHNGSEYYLLKPNCTHVHCFLKWNNDEKTWDCRCHGSRFDITGKVLTGPAKKDLPLLKIDRT